MNTSTVGSVLDDKYKILGEVGRGGMSIVWLGQDVRLGKLWAIKEVLPNTHGERGRVLRQSIVDEANFMKRLDHPSIPRVVDIVDTGSALYVVMDYVNGQSLSSLLSRQKHAFAQDDVVAWGIQLCDVLSYLHGFVTSDGERHQIVYRDLKPSNIMLRDDGQIRLIDFGVCWERMGGQNNDGMVVGTPGYAAPEQLPANATMANDAVVDNRSDIYALGTTLYSLITGHVPKVTRDGGRAQVSFELRPIRVWNPELSEGLERIIAKATQRNAALRYQSIEEMRYDLEHYEELTQEYRYRQLRKVKRFRVYLLATAACVACGFLCMGVRVLVCSFDYATCVREASIASRESASEDVPSDAEQLYVRAIAADPSRVEPYVALIQEVYEADSVFARAEEERWSALFRANEDGLRNNPGYAELCFEAGICYLCFYRSNEHAQAGSTLGQEALANAGKARAWFERVCTVCEVRRDTGHGNDTAFLSFDKGGQTIEDADVLAADAYLRICEFNELKQRSEREGRAAGEVYQGFWDAIRQAVAYSPAYIEGVRLRLYLIAFEAVSADDILAGVYRKALEDGRVDQSRAEAEELLNTVVNGVQAEGLQRFVQSPGNREVYGSLSQFICTNVTMARHNIETTYENPVARYDI